MKGQDEIKKALALCPGDSLECEQDGCPYWDIRLCVPELHIDALELLKEQEPVEPELEGGGSSWWHVCGECHGAIDTSDNYCRHCGRRIKHEKKAE